MLQGCVVIFLEFADLRADPSLLKVKGRPWFFGDWKLVRFSKETCQRSTLNGLII